MKCGDRKQMKEGWLQEEKKAREIVMDEGKIRGENLRIEEGKARHCGGMEERYRRMKCWKKE